MYYACNLNASGKFNSTALVSYVSASPHIKHDVTTPRKFIDNVNAKLLCAPLTPSQKGKKSQFSVTASARLPHLHGSNRHPTGVTLPPSRQPRISIAPEGPLRVRCAINPGFAALAVTTSAGPNDDQHGVLSSEEIFLSVGVDLQEPSVCGANGHVEDEIEFLIERGVASGRVRVCPWIGEEGVVLRVTRETSLLPQGSIGVEFGVQDLIEPVVDVHVDVILIPVMVLVS